jgi:hypothetical protein
MMNRLIRPTTSTTLLARLIDAPDLVRVVRAMAPSTFSALVRHIGVEDAGEIVALATTEQLVAAFDEDLFVVRVLDHCSEATSGYIDDLEDLATVLSAADSLAEDVEAEREERRGKRGYVEPRAARSFLSLARTPTPAGPARAERDPVTRAYFRDLDRRPAQIGNAPSESQSVAGLLDSVGAFVAAAPPALLARMGGARSPATARFAQAMRLLDDDDPTLFGERMEELSYLVNVLLAGAAIDNGRLRPGDAAEAVLTTVALGAEIETLQRSTAARDPIRRSTPGELLEVLRSWPADLLFRRASGFLVAHGFAQFVRSSDDLDAALEQLRSRK